MYKCKNLWDAHSWILDASLIPTSQKGYSRSGKSRKGQQGWQKQESTQGGFILEGNNWGVAWQDMHRMKSNKQSGEGSTVLHSMAPKLQNSLPRCFTRAKNTSRFTNHWQQAEGRKVHRGWELPRWAFNLRLGKYLNLRGTEAKSPQGTSHSVLSLLDPFSKLLLPVMGKALS